MRNPRVRYNIITHFLFVFLITIVIPIYAIGIFAARFYQEKLAHSISEGVLESLKQVSSSIDREISDKALLSSSMIEDVY
ncbi:MAG: hypothetical protein KAU31_07675, partial [Spirochaetaceae bacterium]|nr:hypothetical protein [Spirochaetaceae bacterium]